jgi:hypothetical protein
VLTITSTDGQKAVSMMTIPSSSPNNDGEPKLLFDTVNNQHVLVGVDFGDGESRRVVSKTSTSDRSVVTAAHGRNQ